MDPFLTNFRIMIMVCLALQGNYYTLLCKMQALRFILPPMYLATN